MLCSKLQDILPWIQAPNLRAWVLSRGICRLEFKAVFYLLISKQLDNYTGLNSRRWFTCLFPRRWMYWLEFKPDLTSQIWNQAAIVLMYLNASDQFVMIEIKQLICHSWIQATSVWCMDISWPLSMYFNIIAKCSTKKIKLKNMK